MGLEPPPPPHTKIHIWSINEEEKEEEEEREREEGVVMHHPSQMEINYLPSLVSSVLICGYTLACLDLWEFFIPPPFSYKIIQRDQIGGYF